MAGQARPQQKTILEIEKLGLIYQYSIDRVTCSKFANVAELAYALGLEPSVARHEGSTPSVRTSSVSSEFWISNSVSPSLAHQMYFHLFLVQGFPATNENRIMSRSNKLNSLNLNPKL